MILQEEVKNSLEAWTEKNRLDIIIWDERIFTIKGSKFFIIYPKTIDDETLMFDHEFKLYINEADEEALANHDDIDYIAFCFGGRWYYDSDMEIKELKELKYFGKEKDYWTDTPPFLGIHGSYDLCNGSRDYKDWCKKAKFCGYKVLGIAEENTLAGVLAFQNACDKADIVSVIGETITVQDKEEEQYTVKLYCATETGWKNLLLINAQINVFNKKFVDEQFLFDHAEGLFCVLSPDYNFKRLGSYSISNFVDLYYQFDVSQWDSEERDKKILLSTQQYLKKYSLNTKPILIQDAYYLEKEDAKIRRDLNAIGKLSFKNQSKDQYFKTPNEILDQTCSLFKPEDDERLAGIIDKALEGTRRIGRQPFRIQTEELHLPKYEMTSYELGTYQTNEEFFWHLIERGLEIKVTNEGIDPTPYIDRIETESKVILDAKLHDYFLIIWDILNWSKIQGIKTGYGRGSAGGSVIAFLLDIVKTDPIVYGLLFERFLNEGRLYKTKKIKNEKGEEVEIRIPGSMPDIDNDIQGERREEVKRYIESKYGADRVAGIATYGTFKIKAALSDLARRSGADIQYTKYVTGAIKDADMTFTGFFKEANVSSKKNDLAQYEPSILKKYIQDNPELVEKLPLIFDQPKTSSSHAAGVIIVPKSENGIYDQLPVKMMDGLLVSEWEMDYVEQAGFLKMDILGLEQLDKFDEIIKLIKETRGEDIVLEDIPLDDPKVYKMFCNGYNEDVFQFGGVGLKGYTSALKPSNINDLIVTTALYRPGPIEIGTHNDYIKRKNGDERVHYVYGTEDALKETYGLMCYQEQIMQITRDLAGFTLNEADDIRKAIGKKIPALMATYEGRFIDGAVKNGCSHENAKFLWDQIAVFGTYSFNKSHSVCYGITGYHCQWFKVNYPLQFWTVSLLHANEEGRQRILSEIRQTSTIKIASADINKSENSFKMDAKTNTIYWTISSIKEVGARSVEDILEERKKGHYFSIEEFAARMKGKRGVDKTAIINLIITGAFDELHNVTHIRDRYDILKKYFATRGSKPMDDKYIEMKTWKEYHWVVEQRRLSGLGSLDFSKLLHLTDLYSKVDNYRTCKEILDTPADELPSMTLIAGIVTKAVVKRQTKGDREFCAIEINDGFTIISGMIWSDCYLFYKDLLADPLNKLIVLTAPVRFDEKYKRQNTFGTQGPNQKTRPEYTTVINIIS